MDFITAVPPAEQAAVLNGTSTWDATDALQDVVNNEKYIVMPKGRICLSPTARVYLRNNVHIVAYGTTFLCLSGVGYQAAFWASDVHGWSIRGGFLNGNRANRYQGVGESGIAVFGCEGFRISDMQIENCVGDAIMVSSLDPEHLSTKSRVGYLENIRAESNGRNGFTFCGAEDVTCIGLRARGHVGNNPKSGFVFESDGQAAENRNISLISCQSVGNLRQGLKFEAYNQNITIVGGNYSENGEYGIMRSQSVVENIHLVGNIRMVGNSYGAII